jgi:hypothetical protein
LSQKVNTAGVSFLLFINSTLNLKINTIYIVVSAALLMLFSARAFAQQCSQAEVEYLAANADQLADISQSCAFDCVLDQDQNACLLSCLAEQIPVSEGCLSCSVNQINCVLDNCALACLFPNSQACEDCIAENCLPDYFVCIGDEDVDGFTVEGGDCNNQNADINPGEPDTEGDGIDQNCDGSDGIATEIADFEESPFTIYKSNGDLFIKSRNSGKLNIYNLNGTLLNSFWIKSDEWNELPFNPVLILYTFSGTHFYRSGKL